MKKTLSLIALFMAVVVATPAMAQPAAVYFSPQGGIRDKNEIDGIPLTP